MKTKDRILEESLKVFNEKGLRSTTTRHIAASMGISPGNLHYHFKHTEDIIQTLFDNLIQAFDQILLEFEDNSMEYDLDKLICFFEKVYDILQTYRFIFLNFVEISVWIPKIQDTYAVLLRKRQKQLFHFFRRMVEENVFRNDISQDMWRYWVRSVFIVSDFWLSHNQLTERFIGKAARNEYTKTINALVYPLLKK